MQTAFTLSARYRRQSARTRLLVGYLIRLYAAQRHEAKQKPRNAERLARIGVQVTLCKRLLEAVNRGN